MKSRWVNPKIQVKAQIYLKSTVDEHYQPKSDTGSPNVLKTCAQQLLIL